MTTRSYAIRPIRILALAAGITLLLCFRAAAGSRKPGDGEAPYWSGVQLFDFESDPEIEAWRVRDLTTWSRTTRWAASGKSAAALTFHQWRRGKERWPAVIATAKSGALKVTDFSPFDAIEFRAFNPGRKPATLRLHLRDNRGRRFSRTWSLPPRKEMRCRVDVSGLAGLDAGHVAELHFFVTQPSRTYTVYVDDVRLVLRTPQKARDILYQALAVEMKAEVWSERLRRPLPEAVRTWMRDLPRIRAEAKDVLAAFAGGKVSDARSAAVFRETVDRLQKRLDAARAVVPCILALREAESSRVQGFVLAVESPMRKVFLEAGRFRSRFETHYALEAARNEYESFQIIVFPVVDELRNVRCRIARAPAGPDGASIPMTVRLVGYVYCKQPSYRVPHTGWWPDPLLDFTQQVDRVPVGEVATFWITAHVPGDVPAGVYRGTVEVAADGVPPQTVAVTLTVWDFTLPEHTHLRTALSFRTLAGVYPKDRVKEMTRKYENWMLAQYHLNPGSIYSGGPPKWDVARLKELKRLGLNALNLTYINAPRGAAFNPDRFRKKLADRMKQIAEWLPRAEAAGVRDLCYIYCFDERPPDQLDVVFDTAERLKRKWPDIEVMTTAYDRTFGMNRKNGSAVDIWVPLTPHFDSNAARIAEARKAGRQVWWYICIGPKHPYANWFIEYPAIEARLLMGAMTAKYRPDGFLYYAVNRWPVNHHPIRSGPRTDWNPASYKNNNGDGSIMCAGPDGPLATVRLENIRDGIEDFEYYHLLRQLLAQVRKTENTSARKHGFFTRMLRRAGRVLGLVRSSRTPDARLSGEVPADVVADLTHFTHNPEVLLRERRRVARAILTLQQTVPARDQGE